MQKIIFFLLILISVSGRADCPLAESFFKKGKTFAAINFLRTCAIGFNDDDSQMKLAKMYTTGENNVPKDSNLALYYYQLAAETGNAEAQLALAEALMKADQTPETRDKLLAYRSQLGASGSGTNSFNGDFMHPYALLMLASEAPGKKWYYPSQVRTAPVKALTLYKSYKISEDNKRSALRQASQFKTRKLLQTAKEVYSDEEYPEIAARLKDSQTQKQALADLKQKMEEYIQNKKEIRKVK